MRWYPAGPRVGREMAPPPCSTSKKASIASVIGTSTCWPSPVLARWNSAAMIEYASTSPDTLSASSVGIRSGRPFARRITSGTPQAAWMMSSNAGASACGLSDGNPCAWQ